jgi:ApaG protein
MQYEDNTDGIVIRVKPSFSLPDSSPNRRRYVFSYQVEIENGTEEAAQLLFRHWRIHDSTGEDRVVDGEGVVGEQPRLDPGASHQYKSFCVLSSPVGHMEGHYTFGRTDGKTFKVRIPRFRLEAFLPGPEEGEMH